MTALQAHEMLETVVDHLQTDAGLTDAFVEHFLGAIIVPCGPYQLVFGTVNETWGGDVNLADDCIDYLETGVPSDCADPTEISLAITLACQKFDQEYCPKA